MFSSPRKSVITYPEAFQFFGFRKNGRSSDSSQLPVCLPDIIISGKEIFTGVLMRLTAAGLSGIRTRFPINDQWSTAFARKVTNSS